MALLEEQFTEKLQAGASPITYEGEEGREQQIAQALWDKLPPQVRMQFGSFQQFFSSGAWKKVLEMLQQQMQGSEEIQETETETIGRAPQEGLGALMPAPRPMAFGGIAGADGRRQYGIGSWFQKKIMDPIKSVVKSPVGKIGLGALAANYLPKLWGGETLMSRVPNILSGVMNKDLDTDNPNEMKNVGNWLGKTLMNPNFLIPAASLVGGAFAKPDEPGYTGQGTGLNIQDIGKLANISSPQVGQAAGLRFLPDVETRKFTPEEMIETYAGQAHGGRIGYADGTPEIPEGFLEDFKRREYHEFLDKFRRRKEDYERRRDLAPTQEAAQGGRIGAQEGGLMDLGGMEKDYREDGGFVPIGGEEKADDVPARLSRNEFVFTADAVRAAGGGDIDQGAEVMENVMKNLERGGEISEESQGQGARDMFQVSERLSEVV